MTKNKKRQSYVFWAALMTIAGFISHYDRAFSLLPNLSATNLRVAGPAELNRPLPAPQPPPAAL
jgi:hypothetical protein